LFRGLSILKDLIKNPTKAFDEISENGKDFLIWSVLIVILPKIISACLHSNVHYLKGVITGVAEWLIIVILLYIVGRLLKGKANFFGLLSAIGYAQFPLIFLPVIVHLILLSIPKDVIAVIQNTSGELSKEQRLFVITRILTPTTVTLSLTTLVLMLWSFALSVIAVRECCRFSTWRAFCSVVFVTLVDMLAVARLFEGVGL
jgi:hypothetical protein